MPRIKKIPSRPNFNQATQKAYELLIELNIKELPVDPFEIIKEFEDKIIIFEWSDLARIQGVEDPFKLKRDKAEAKTQIMRGTGIFMIVYKERVRWTIAHEIGHILLGHLIHYDATALNRSGLTKKEYGILEVEAHWFAGILLSPHSILNLYDIKDSQLISFLCNISKESGEKCEGYVKNYRIENDETINILFRNFYEFFYREKYLESITDGIFKFYDSDLYNDFYRICRICKHCNAYAFNEEQNFCHICGKDLPFIDWPYKQQSGLMMWRGWPEYLEGKYYPSIETDDNNKVLFCPVCKNHDLLASANHCKICATPLQNICSCGCLEIDGKCRYCPDCGNTTLFNDLGVFGYLKEVELPDLLTFEESKYEDYIEYEHWDFMKAAIYYWKKDLNLYSVIEGSKAIIDDDSFIIFSTDKTSSNMILENKDLIIKCLEEYGHKNIKTVEVYHDL